MTVTWITPVNITPGTAGSWVDVGVSSYVAVGCTGVIFELRDSSAGNFGCRKNGSTDARLVAGSNSAHCMVSVGVDSNRIFEANIYSTSNISMYLMGYYNDDAVFLTNGVDKTPASASAWTDMDISSDTGSDTAIGAIFEHYSSSGSVLFSGIRMNGSTDDRRKRKSHLWSIIGVDANEICEGHVSNTGLNLFLVGYVTKESSFNANGIDRSLASLNVWTSLAALPAGATGGMYESVEADSGSQDWGLRFPGAAAIVDDLFHDHVFAWVQCDANRLVEGRVTSTTVDFFELGYTQAAAAAVATPRLALLGCGV